MLKLTGHTNLRPSIVNIGLLKSTGRAGLEELTEDIGSLKLNKHMCLLGLAGGKGFQTLTGYTGLLKFWYIDNKAGNWSPTIENDTALVPLMLVKSCYIHTIRHFVFYL